MAPIKFEEKLKDKLENRTLTPSADAWSTLADKLDKEDKKSNNAKFWWLGIAASIVGVVLITTQFYKDNADTKDLPAVVDTQTILHSETETTNKSIDVIPNFELKTEIIKDTQTNVATSTSDAKTIEAKKTIKKASVITQPEISKEIIASNNNAKSKEENQTMIEALSQEELKIMEVVDAIKQLKTDKSSVSDREIDSLLKHAQREILKQRIFDESLKTVSAEALLQDVEVELEQSFRDKVYEALKSSYNSVKTAVAERRN